MKLYAKISQIVDQDRTVDLGPGNITRSTNMTPFSFLDQKGPKTLNQVIKKNQMSDINAQNKKIKAKIDNARSNYSLKQLDHHAKNFERHKTILMGQSPSVAKLDPLIRKIDHSFGHKKVKSNARSNTSFRIGGPHQL